MNHSDALPTTAQIRLDRSRDFAEVVGRIWLAAIFLISGIGKIGAYSDTVAYMRSAGLSGELLPLVIVAEILGAMAIIVGYQTRITAFLLAGFTLIAGLVFHQNVGDPNQATHLLKNVAIAGGFLVLTFHGAGAYSLDQRLVKNHALSDEKNA